MPGPEPPVMQVQAAPGLTTSEENQKVSNPTHDSTMETCSCHQNSGAKETEGSESDPFFEGLCPFPQQSCSSAGCFSFPHLCPEVGVLAETTRLRRG